MSSLGPPSALETLLILKGHQIYGSRSTSLDSLSQILKSSKIVPRNATSDSECFEPKALKSLYLRLLKEEVKLEGPKKDGSTLPQDEQDDPSERKLSSPPLETMEEAADYRYLIPQIATKVYDDYRKSTIKVIEEEESKYRLLQKDIQEIERGEWDTRLQQQDITSKRDSKGLSSIQTLLRDEPDPSHDSSKLPNVTPSAQLPSIHRKLPDQTTPPTVPIWENPPQAVPYANGDQSAITPSGSGASPRDSAATVAGSPIRARQPVYTPHEPPSNAPRPPSQSGSAENGAPFLPPPQHAQQSYRMVSPPSETHRPQSSQPANIAASPSTRPHQTPLPPPERSSGSPIILPPPPGMLRTTSSSSGPLDALADMAGHQYRPGAVPSPRLSQPSSGPQHPVQLPLPSNYAHRGYQYPSYDSRTSYQNAYPPYHPSSMPPYPPQHHPHASPYQYPGHAPGQSPHYASRATYQTPVHAYPQYSPYANASPYTPHGLGASPYAPYPPPRALDQQTPVSGSDVKKQLPKLSRINTSVSSTRWKNSELPGGPRSPKSPIRPRADEISPISPSPGLEPPEIYGTTTVSERDNVSSAMRNLPPPSDLPPTAKARRGRPARGTSTRGRGNRAPSTASSVPQARTRSASAFSGVDELSLEPPTSAVNRTSIKPEPPATPARESSASIPPTMATTDNEGNRKSTRRRRETLRGMESTAETTRITHKRKRATTDASEIDQPGPKTIPSAFDKQKEELSRTHILASRNLPRTSATLINDITGHKLASMFAKPLTEREAPGYHSLIYRPQDFKSIKQAITNGNRALTALIDQEHLEEGDASVVPVAGASESDMRIWVQKNEDIIPPRGIVNSAQLEREIMRVFANAVMFNPDPNRSFGPAFRTRAKLKERHVPVHLAGDEGEADEEGDREEEEGGVVKDTREMFEDVDRVVGAWRAAEKAAEEASSTTKVGKMKSGEEEEADELAGEESAVAGGEEGAEGRAGKRRRR